METDWSEAIAFVLEAEGGYTVDPNDPGGETNWGISKKAYPNLDIKNLTRDQAIEIYKRDFWNACKCFQLPRAWAISVFDSAVNQGVGTSIKIMQRTLGVKDDGVIGPITLAAATKATPRTATLLLARRLVQYHDLMIEKPNLDRYKLNWFQRVIALAKIAL